LTCDFWERIRSSSASHAWPPLLDMYHRR
jgi:hypothetical protein